MAQYMAQRMSPTRELESSECCIYPRSEVLKHVRSIDNTCILEVIGSDTIPGGYSDVYSAVTTYAAHHFAKVDLLIGSKRSNEGEEGFIGNNYRRAMGIFSRLVEELKTEEKESSKALQLEITLGLGVFKHTFQERTIFLCHFVRDLAVGDSSGAVIYHGAVLFAEGKNEETKKCLQDFTKVCMEWHHHRTYSQDLEENKFRFFRYISSECGDGCWEPQGVKNARKESTVILRKDLKEEILADVEDFLSEETAQWYKKFDIPRRRSYLFYGSPGAGKTSLIKVLAGKYRLNACFLSLDQKSVNNQVIGHAISTIPSEALLVLEDVDSLFERDRSSKDKVEVTFSGVLNMLDGIVSGEGRITIMTTNHLERLDASLIRCGRVDRMFDISTPDKEQIVNYFTTFYPQSSQETRNQFAEEIMNLQDPQKKSMATLQQFFIFVRKDSADKAVARIFEFYKKFFEARLPNQAPSLYA